ncbi:glycoside hydrolase family 26 protein [Rufibacter roseolus]|uniref:glycoside hydrolase family 26 protein n=1 Tax=Rufibacter roseolus TaxID=2817375 RepID=UPI001B313419|nr:glycosyl hydrolase [Rufibacter roseolus]
MKNRIVAFALTALSLFSSCGSKESEPEPEIPVVTPQTPFKTLNYLYSISGSKTVSGIHNREPNATPARWTEEMKTVTGKYSGLWSGDFLFQADNINNRQIMVNEAWNQWKKGAIVNIMWHACNPAMSQPCGWDANGVLSKLTDAQWTELVTDGTPLNAKWKAMMDEVSVHLQFLEDKGVEVLWRPLHEMNQGNFWWGGRPGANGTRKLYQITHDYMTKTKGLTNLIWVWDVQDFSTLENDLVNYNPGEGYWDIAALDFYDGSGFSQGKYNAMVKAAKGKPIAIGECERLPTVEDLTYQPKWTFFMGWSELVFERNTAAEMKALQTSSKVITLDEMPGW